MSNETVRDVRVSYHLCEKRSCQRAARIFSEESLPPREVGAEIHAVAPSRRKIYTTYTRHDLPPPATALPLK